MILKVLRCFFNKIKLKLKKKIKIKERQPHTVEPSEKRLQVISIEKSWPRAGYITSLKHHRIKSWQNTALFLKLHAYSNYSYCEIIQKYDTCPNFTFCFLTSVLSYSGYVQSYSNRKENHERKRDAIKYDRVSNWNNSKPFEAIKSH